VKAFLVGVSAARVFGSKELRSVGARKWALKKGEK
jgi:hypothetical protein